MTVTAAQFQHLALDLSEELLHLSVSFVVPQSWFLVAGGGGGYTERSKLLSDDLILVS